MFGLGSAASRDATEPSFEAIYRAVLELVAKQSKPAPKPIGKVSVCGRREGMSIGADVELMRSSLRDGQ